VDQLLWNHQVLAVEIDKERLHLNSTAGIFLNDLVPEWGVLSSRVEQLSNLVLVGMALHLLSQVSMEGCFFEELLALLLVDLGEQFVASRVDQILLHGDQFCSKRRINIHEHKSVLEVDEEALVSFRREGGLLSFFHRSLKVFLEQLLLDVAQQVGRVERSSELAVSDVLAAL